MMTAQIISSIAATIAVIVLTVVTAESNPLLQDWSSEPFSLPPFQKIKPSHYKEALEVGMVEHLFELQSIVNNTDEPTFKNTIVAYDQAGSHLGKISSVYFNMGRSLNTDELKEIQKEVNPILSRHYSDSYYLSGLFERIDAIFRKRDVLNLTPEEKRLVETFHLDFTRQGVNFSEKEKEEYADIETRLENLQTQFSQNVMKDEETYEIVLSKDDMDGCPDYLIEAARQVAVERNKTDGEYVITLSRSLVESFIAHANRRDLRQKVWQAFNQRGELSVDRVNLPIAVEILKLRKRQAEMHGYRSFAEYQLDNRMAKNTDNVMELLENVWERAKVAANREREALEAYCNDIGVDLGKEGIQPWDWMYYAEKVKMAKYHIDESTIRPYFSLDKITDAAMDISNKLFGLKYIMRGDISSYHPDVKTYEVRDASDNLVAIYITDNFARMYKSSGAWNSNYRVQTKNLAPGVDDIGGIPIISNNNNFAKGTPTLLSFADATTLFHELGHAHHGMLSNVTYYTSVLTDWVELPSTLMEYWLDQPNVLNEYSRHYKTNESIPEKMLSELKATEHFNVGYSTTKYTISAILDISIHQIDNYDDFNITKFEQEQLKRLDVPKGIVMRHRPAHFKHIFAGSHYAAGYYVYIWAEVLGADIFAAFEETGDVFDPATAARAKRYIYSSGNTAAPDELFRMFRGRDPDITFMLKKRGLVS